MINKIGYLKMSVLAVSAATLCISTVSAASEAESKKVSASTVTTKYKSLGDMMQEMRMDRLDFIKRYDAPLAAKTLKNFKKKRPVLRSNTKAKDLSALFRPSSESVWKGHQKPGMFLSVQLNAPLEIGSITMDHGSDKHGYVRGYEIYFSDNGKQWGQPVVTGEGAPVKTTIQNLKGTARWIKIQMKGKNSSWTIKDLLINNVSLRLGGFDMKQMWDEFPVQTAWLTQDAVLDREAARKNSEYNVGNDILEYFEAADTKLFLKRIITNALSDSGAQAALYKQQFDQMIAGDVTDSELFALYELVCKVRRKERLKPLLAKTKQIIFAKRPIFGGIFYVNEMSGSKYPTELSSIDLTPELSGEFAEVTTFFDSQNGMVRDPEISFDGKKMLFAWRKTRKDISMFKSYAPETGNYQIYEMDLATKKIRQLTTDETYGANKEPLYLPDGNILFNSQRIVQHITCGWGDCSNFYLMDKDGNYQRRIGFDQTNTVDPVVSNDGRVLYLRRDYNDRGQTAAHALFQMRPDGTMQTEYYGNQTGNPNSFQMPAPIPDSKKIMVVLGGYHANQGGQLAIMNVSNGRQNADGLIRIPQGDKPPTSERGHDKYAKDGIQYSFPQPISETEFVVGRSDAWGTADEQYRIFFMNSKGERELLASDADTSCMNPVLVMPRKKPTVRPSMVDYTKKTGTMYVQDVYKGSAAKGIKPGSIKKLRVVEILYKHDTVRFGMAGGQGGGAHSVTPSGHGLASFDTKRILGEATVYEDGSAMFEVPARVPVYLQMLDGNNRVVQTMRSWTTLMPGERFSCIGCHEGKDETPVMGGKVTMAFKKGVEKLKPFYGETRAFSYLKEVQPVFDKHCVKCHKQGEKAGNKLLLTAEPFVNEKLTGRRFAQSYVKLAAARPGPDPSKWVVIKSSIPEWNRSGSAKADEPNKYVNYWTRLNTMAPKPPYYAGSITSGLVKKLEEGHVKKLPQEALDKICAWIDLNLVYTGEYNDPTTINWNKNEIDRYAQRVEERKRNEAIETKAIKTFIDAGQP